MLLQGMEQCSVHQKELTTGKQHWTTSLPLAMLVVPVEGSSCQHDQCHHDEISEPINERTGPGLDGPYRHRPGGITRGAARLQYRRAKKTVREMRDEDGLECEDGQVWRNFVPPFNANIPVEIIKK